MKILLIGKAGMLGNCFLRHLEKMPEIELEALDHGDLDITDDVHLQAAFQRIVPNLVINCSAYTDVDGCEAKQDKAFAINAEAVGRIASLCKQYGAVLIHFSTDYVFDGEAKLGYAEDSIPSPINVYGESKLGGENLIREKMDWYYIVRTSWLFGRNGKNFVDTMVALAEEKNDLRVVNDQVGSPTYTEDLCKAVIENFVMVKADFGIYHLTNSETCSWFEFAKEIFRLRNLKVDVSPISSEEFARPAKRPHFSILLNAKLGKLRSWQAALRDYLSF